jgi:hypothetical protein
MARVEQHDDDAALHWEGDDAPETPVAAAPAPAKAEQGERAKPAQSSFFLVMYGVLAGIYLIYTVGWLVGMHHVASTGGSALTVISAAVAQGLALASPTLWFLTTLYLTRKRSAVSRLLALIAGLAVVLPWPFILLGA